VLTIACHPDPRRLGQRACLSGMLLGEVAEISRTAPAFSSRSGRGAASLDDPYLSRSPIRLERLARGIRVDPAGSRTALRVSGEQVLAAVDIDAAALERGVPLQLGERVLLWLHLGHPHRATDAAYGLVGESPAMDALRGEIERVAPEPMGVLLRGETGSGKELVAEAIHRTSSRTRGPFVSVNMGAVPPTTATADLFGHTRGAFTGASEPHRGFFGRADGGTLFLDEIGETPQDVQPLLLRALETGEIQSVGGQRPLRVDVRVIAATDANLEGAVAEGALRPALLHRLAEYEIRLPPLRDRKSDLPALFWHFLGDAVDMDRLGQRARTAMEGGPSWLDPALMGRLLAFEWPGNVRQLRNAVRQIAVASRDAECALTTPAVERMLGGEPEPTPLAPPAGGRTDLDSIGDDALIAALRTHQFRIAATARALGISKNSLYQLMEECPRVRKAGDLEPPEIERALAEAAGDLEQAAASLEVSERGLKLRMTQLGMSA
jgi:two-component system nitrogen regulation response regulator GlnG